MDVLDGLRVALASELRSGQPSFGDERAGTPAGRAWEIRVPASAGRAAEVTLRDAVLEATGARVRIATDTLWTVLHVERIEIHGDSASVSLDRGTRECSTAHGSLASGYTYAYTLARRSGRWHVVASRPVIAYDPGPRADCR